MLGTRRIAAVSDILTAEQRRNAYDKISNDKEKE